MRNYINLLCFEKGRLWFLLALPVVYLFVLIPSFHLQEQSTSGLSIIPGAFLLVQNSIMMYPIFQNRTWGSLQTGTYSSLEFTFTRALSRSRLFWTKATLYLLSSVLFGLTFLGFALVKPEIHIVEYRSTKETQLTRDFYLASFPGAYLEKTPTKKHAESEIVLPRY